MDRITATAETLMRQAQDTAEIYLHHAIRWVKEQELPRKDWPTFVGIYVEAASRDFLAAVTLEGLQEVTEGLEGVGRAIADLAEALPATLAHDEDDEL